MKETIKMSKRFLLFVLLTLATLILFSPAAVLAQPGWSPDLQVTYINGSAYSPQIAVSGETLHVVWTEFARDSLGTYEDVLYVQSTDSGSHWNSPRMLSDRNPRSSVMPSLVLQGDELHVVWSRFDGGICYCKSTDGGLTWGGIDTSVLRGGRLPKLAIAGDSLYLVAVDVSNRLTRFRKSTDRGTSWLPALDLGSGWQRPQIFVQRNLVHVIVEVELPLAAEVAYTRSTDGGLSWTPMIYLSSDDSLNSAWPSLTGEDYLNLFLVWMDGKYSPYSWTGDIFLRRSTDGGTSWAPEESLTVEHRAQASDILAQGDTLHMVWEDERVDPGKNFELYYRMSEDKGLTWGPEVRLTYAPMNSTSPSLGLGENYLHLVWTDGRGDTTYNWAEVYHKRKVLFPSGVEVSPLSTPIRNLSDLRISPNPAKGWVWLSGSPLGKVSIYDVSGRLVRNLSFPEGYKDGSTILWNCRDERGKEVGGGVYFVRIEGQRQTHKVVVIR
jgi:hypothetical protein